MESVFFHIDVNSAYLSWTAITQKQQAIADGRLDTYIDLRRIPAIIGGDSSTRHGVVLAKSIPAKKYGITTGEAVMSALKKCPNLTIVPPNHTLYEQYSEKLMTYLSSFCPILEQVSIDECYMDYTPIAREYTSPVEAADIIKDGIRNTFGFTVNIGISNRKVLAKMASDFKKPDLVHTLYSYEIREKMWPLPVSSLFMCGKSSAEILRKLGITTIGGLAASDRNLLISHLKSHGALLWDYANGIDSSGIEHAPSPAKGIGNSITLSKDALTLEDMKPVLLQLSESVSGRLRAVHALACTLTVEIKYNNFQSVSHQMSLQTPENSSQAIYASSFHLLQELWNGNPVRLLGIRTSKLQEDTAPIQMNLFSYQTDDKQAIRNKKLDKTIDDIRRKYGDTAIVRGSLLSMPHTEKTIPKKNKKES